MATTTQYNTSTSADQSGSMGNSQLGNYRLQAGHGLNFALRQTGLTGNDLITVLDAQHKAQDSALGFSGGLLGETLGLLGKAAEAAQGTTASLIGLQQAQQRDTAGQTATLIERSKGVIIVISILAAGVFVAVKIWGKSK